MKTNNNTNATANAVINTRKETATAAAARKGAEVTAADIAAIRTAEKYGVRVALKTAEIQSISKLWNNTREAYGAVIAGASFKSFVEYMKGRHNVSGNESPRRWSGYYAAQFCERYAKTAAADPKHADHAAASAYLYAEQAANRSALIIKRAEQQSKRNGGKAVSGKAATAPAAK